MIKNLVLLGGNNPDNAAWLKRMGANLAEDYSVYVYEYGHWHSGGNIDFGNELKALRTQVSTLKDYAVVGKSAGGLIALMGLKDGTFVTAEKIVVIGFPASWAQERNIAYEGLLAQDERIGYIQATGDPKCRYSTLVNMLEGSNIVEEYHSRNHAYSKVKTICSKVRHLLAS